VRPVEQACANAAGYFLLYESMLPSVLSARDRFLKPGGLVVPTQCSILLAAIDSSELLDGRATFWDDVYGAFERSPTVLTPQASRCLPWPTVSSPTL